MGCVMTHPELLCEYFLAGVNLIGLEARDLLFQVAPDWIEPSEAHIALCQARKSAMLRAAKDAGVL